MAANSPDSHREPRMAEGKATFLCHPKRPSYHNGSFSPKHPARHLSNQTEADTVQEKQ